ncbi:hypothetical protein E2562_034622 [Oryza meyeriana var. granulata]|uniref:Uncharacterized protein n=1 Tax=Oryza meyeriana var. granulata TaxID=110450 RepID=A0A6G1E780_9ORYZ|nr:hypothetical protein E2562_034622 [Oryza meyeriana var. granulata]
MGLAMTERYSGPRDRRSRRRCQPLGLKEGRQTPSEPKFTTHSHPYRCPRSPRRNSWHSSGSSRLPDDKASRGSRPGAEETGPKTRLVPEEGGAPNPPVKKKKTTPTSEKRPFTSLHGASPDRGPVKALRPSRFAWLHAHLLLFGF